MTEIILGPPGTGKTTKLIRLVEDALSRGVPPDRIGYFSFTVKAATEAMERARAKFKLEKKDLPNFSTLHSMCFKQLGIKRHEVLSGARMKEFAEYAGVEISGNISEDGTSSGFSSGDRLLFMENLSRIRQIPLQTLHSMDDDGLSRGRLLDFAARLQEFKEAHGLLDFTDMLSDFLRQRIKVNLEELFIDESQDLSALQWRVVERLAEGCKRVAVAGDDDQAIYRWAGADVDHLIDMRGDVKVLNQSYRVPRTIQDLANSVISGVRHRREKKWAAREADGRVDQTMSFNNVDCSSGQILVLARNIYVIAEQIEPALRHQGILYRRLPYENWSVGERTLRAMTMWERLRKGGLATVKEIREIYGLMTLGRGVKRGFKTLSGHEEDTCHDLRWMKKEGGLLREDEWYDALDMIPRSQIGYIRKALQRGENLRKVPRVTISTIHGSKGGEADHVVIMKEMASRTYQEMQKNPEDERRVWYVAATRARERLTLVEPQRDSARKCPWL